MLVKSTRGALKRTGRTELPWPKSGDVVFREEGNSWLDLCLDRRADWDAYASGYKCAADALVERAMTEGHQADLLTNPIVFLYRHYLELRLKEIIIRGRDLLGHDRSQDWHGHDIKRLWTLCRRVLRHVWPKCPRCDLDAIGTCISEWNSVDPSSAAFRYPEDKAGDPLLMKHAHLDIENLSRVVGRIAGLLDSTSHAISIFRDDRHR